MDGKWVSVKDRMPEDGVSVLTSNSIGEMMVTFHIDGDGWFDITDGETISDDCEDYWHIVAWMELPEAYKEEI